MSRILGWVDDRLDAAAERAWGPTPPYPGDRPAPDDLCPWCDRSYGEWHDEACPEHAAMLSRIVAALDAEVVTRRALEHVCRHGTAATGGHSCQCDLGRDHARRLGECSWPDGPGRDGRRSW